MTTNTADVLAEDLATLRRSLPAIVGPETAELWMAFGRIEKALGQGIYAEVDTRELERLRAVEAAAHVWSAARAEWSERIDERSRKGLIRAGDALRAALTAKPSPSEKP